MCGMKSAKSDCTDALSNLPGNIIDSILACLSLRDAVRTSALSREWRNKWKSVPKLAFDVHFQKTLSLLPSHRLENIVYRVLLQHQGNINKFSLRVLSYISSIHIDRWIPLLPTSSIQDFTLHLYGGSKHGFKPPFFSFQNLMHLNLYRCVFQPPPQFRGFSRLITLDFQEVEFVPAVFGQFVSLCLLLERVRLVACTELKSFEVLAPCLRFFTFHGEFKTILFKNSPVLAEVSLSTPVSDKGLKYFHLLPSLEKLHLHPRVLEVLGAGGSSQYLVSLNSLKVLYLSMYLESVREVTCALRLARSSPQLQMLHVSLYASTTVGAVIKFMRDQETPDHHLNHLRKLQIAVFSGIEPQIEFVRYLLASAAGLEEIVIALASSALISDLRLMDLLKQFPCASPTVQLVVVRG
ncbi:hypothetical protein C2S51_024511 [Perilla frutescens var. frutescens]|nr:hypothetical protein C2S51_024511 [Perilla frutescens var. frutescens]